MNKWCSGFTDVKEFAADMDVPLIGVWSNKNCSHCEKFEGGVVREPFVSWMAESQCVFYFGYGTDTSADDKRNGKGFNWCWGPDKTTPLFPLVRVYWKSGGVDWIGMGDSLDQRLKNEEGSKEIVKKLKSILKKYTPVTPEDLSPGQPYTWYIEKFQDALDRIEADKRGEYDPGDDKPEPGGQSGALASLFGIGHDCEVRTKDNKRFRYSAQSRTFTRIG